MAATVLLALALVAPLVTPAERLPTQGSVAAADGVPIRYRVAGAGQPALVFVHCWACDHRLWDAQVAAFAATHTVVTLDLAGHGESGRERRRWTIEAFGDDVRAVVERLGLRQVVLIGHSMGGPVILEAALRLGSRVAGLVPVDTLTDVDQRQSPEEIQAFLATFRADYPAAAARFIREWMWVPSSDPALIERVVRQTAAAPAEIATQALESAWRYDARPALRAIKAPIRALNADKFPTNLEAARRAAPQFDAVIMPGVGHYLMLEDPERFNRLLAGILTRLSGP